MFRVADDGSVSFEPTSSSSTASGRTPPDALSSNQPSPSLVGWAVRADGSVFVVEPGGRERDVSLNLADIPFTVGDDHGLAAGAADDDAASLASTVASSASQIDGMVSRGFEKALAMICFDVGWIDDGSTSVTSISKAMAAGGSAVFGPATDEIVRRCIDYAAIVDCFDEACASSGGAKRRRQSTPNAQSSASSGAAATPASAVTTPAPAGLLTRAKKVLHDAAASLTSSAAPAPSPTSGEAERLDADARKKEALALVAILDDDAVASRAAQVGRENLPAVGGWEVFGVGGGDATIDSDVGAEASSSESEDED